MRVVVTRRHFRTGMLLGLTPQQHLHYLNIKKTFSVETQVREVLLTCVIPLPLPSASVPVVLMAPCSPIRGVCCEADLDVQL